MSALIPYLEGSDARCQLWKEPDPLLAAAALHCDMQELPFCIPGALSL